MDAISRLNIMYWWLSAIGTVAYIVLWVKIHALTKRIKAQDHG